MTPVITNETLNASALVRVNPLARSSFAPIATVLLSCIQNFIAPKEIATGMHLVNSRFRLIWGNDGCLDLSNSNIDNGKLARIILEYQKYGKLVSLNLSKCKKITDAGLALF